jgi:hypothetical protein
MYTGLGHRRSATFPNAISLYIMNNGMEANFACASGQFFASTLQVQLFELKNEDAIKKI